MRRRLRSLAPALLLMASACARHGVSESELPRTDSPVQIDVNNQHALPMEVYALGSGITHRLGTVHPGMRAHFVLPQNLVGGGSVRFEARPSGNGASFRSGEILLAQGAVVDFQIAAQLFNSTVTRRF